MLILIIFLLIGLDYLLADVGLSFLGWLMWLFFGGCH